MVRYRTCSIKGCEDKVSSRHMFPNPEKFLDIFYAWVQLCGNDVMVMDPKEVYRKKRVCNSHFTPFDIYSNSLLRKNVIPSLNLPTRTDTYPGQLTGKEIHQAASTSYQTVDGDSTKCNTEDIPLLEDMPSTSTKQFVTVSPTKKRKMSVLQDIAVTREKDLSPKAKRLYRKNKELKKSLYRIKRANLRLKTKVHVFTKSELVRRATDNLEPHVAEFIQSQIRLTGRHPHGRRFTLNDKCLALILYKQSPQAYRLFSKLFSVPARKTITSLLQNIPLNVGINQQILENLKEIVLSFMSNEKICVLLFDEMAIQPNISFCIKTKYFNGFEDLGDTSSSKIADHAIVFMLRGVTRDWKQPIAFGFTKGSIKTTDLVRLLKNIIQQCKNIGLKIIATVSDQGPSNVAAINYLMKNSVKEAEYVNRKCYKIENDIIYHIFDPPHLIKGVRNNLITKNLVWNENNVVNIAKWEDIYNAYLLDNACGELRLMPKLTDEHCHPKKVKKMKVSIATQTLSYSVAAAISVMAISGLRTNTQNPVNATAVSTAKIIKFFDNLFDSVNGNSVYPLQGKKLRCAMKIDSPHHKFFEEAKRILKNMYFKKEKAVYIPPSLKNWIFTIQGIEDIFKKLKGDVSFLRLRVFNQDPLENFFGQMRQRGLRNVNPTSVQFQSNYKSLIINNLTSKHSIHANCEGDSLNIITNIKNFIGKKFDVETEERTSKKVVVPAVNISTIDSYAIAYIGGYICKKLRFLYQCTKCKNNLICVNTDDEWYSFIKEKEFSADVPYRLKYATPQLIIGLFKLYRIIMINLPQLAEKDITFKFLLEELNANVSFNFPYTCSHTDFIKKKL